MDSPKFSGKWAGRFVSPAGNIHDFVMLVDESAAPVSVRMTMLQTKRGATEPSPVSFETHANVSGSFIGLLSRDQGGRGFNCMALQLADAGKVARGQIIWNSISDDCVHHGETEFRRSPDQK